MVKGKRATILVAEDGRYLDASPDALDLLGVTRAQLLSMSGSDFSRERADPEETAAFRAAWEAAGRRPILGITTLRRPDGTEQRIRFMIEPRPDGNYLATIQPAGEPAPVGTRIYTLGDVLAEWRAAERRLAEIQPGTDEWRAVRADVDALRTRYQVGFDAVRGEASA